MTSSASDRIARRQVWRDRHMPVGAPVLVHDGTRATVPAEVLSNVGVMIRVRLADGREVCRYDHEVYVAEEASQS